MQHDDFKANNKRKLYAEPCSVRVSANIALIKYWGKADEELNIPMQDSISLTIDELYASTRVSVFCGDGDDVVKVNGSSKLTTHGTRFHRVFTAARAFYAARNPARGSIYFEVISTLNFPPAAGLASSAAGFAAIAVGIQHILDMPPQEARRLARLGSGSAIRSMEGGLVRWRRNLTDESDAQCVINSSYWPSLRALILIVTFDEKDVGSTDGMKATCLTSELFRERIRLTPHKLESIERFFRQRDFPSLANAIMKDSNCFHAVCLDTFPPLMYHNDSTRHIMQRVHDFNIDNISPKVAYTVDAGANVCIFLEEDTTIPFLNFLTQHLTFAPEARTKVELILGKAIQNDKDQPILLDLFYSTVGCSPKIIVEN